MRKGHAHHRILGDSGVPSFAICAVAVLVLGGLTVGLFLTRESFLQTSANGPDCQQRTPGATSSRACVSATIQGAQFIGTTSNSTPNFPSTTPDSLTLPIRAAFYYGWYPTLWNSQGFAPFTNYHPSLGFYDGAQPTVISKHIAAMQYGGIQAGIASWWGPGSREDERMPLLLAAAAGTGFKWGVYYENEARGDPTVDQIRSDLTYLRNTYAADPNFLRIDSKFVIFVYTSAADNCTTADRWKQANTVGAWIDLMVFPGFTSCISQPDQWHSYAPAEATDHRAGHSYGISPGFWKKGEAKPRLTRDLVRWNQDIRDMIASNEPFQLVLTFNEWGEGTPVENATDWASPSGYGYYLDALHSDGNGPIPTQLPNSLNGGP